MTKLALALIAAVMIGIPAAFTVGVFSAPERVEVPVQFPAPPPVEGPIHVAKPIEVEAPTTGAILKSIDDKLGEVLRRLPEKP